MKERTGRAGYEYLLAYKITVPIYDYTVVFCKRAQSPSHPRFPTLSSSRTFDQMVQAARSGSMNIAEGHQQASLEGYIKLTGVNFASLEELLKDYISYARQNNLPIWPHERVVREVGEVREVWAVIRRHAALPDFPDFPNLPDSPDQAVNMMLTLINQAIYLQKRLRIGLEQKFVKNGGYRETLFRKRLNYKNRS